MANAGRVVSVLTVVALSGFAGLPSARACRIQNDFLHAIPPSGGTLPSGEVHVALAYSYASNQLRLTGFRVENQLGDDVPVTFAQRGDAWLLQLDTTGSSEVTVFEFLESPEGSVRSTMRATYTVSTDAPDPSAPTPPTISLGEVTCDPCPPVFVGSSCCNPGDQLSTKVTFLATDSGTILGWVDGDGQLVGVITRATYESADSYSFAPTLPPQGASIVAMSVAGVMSTPVTWAVEEAGPCQGGLPDAGRADASWIDDDPADKGCAASPSGSTGTWATLVALGLLTLVRRRRTVSC